MKTITVLIAVSMLGLTTKASAADCDSCSNVPVNPTYVSPATVSPATPSPTACCPQPVTYYYAPSANCCPTTSYPYVAPRPVVTYRPVVSYRPTPYSYSIGRQTCHTSMTRRRIGFGCTMLPRASM